jgi:hypothetical protein
MVDLSADLVPRRCFETAEDPILTALSSAREQDLCRVERNASPECRD